MSSFLLLNLVWLGLRSVSESIQPIIRIWVGLIRIRFSSMKSSASELGLTKRYCLSFICFSSLKVNCTCHFQNFHIIRFNFKCLFTELYCQIKVEVIQTFINLQYYCKNFRKYLEIYQPMFGHDWATEGLRPWPRLEQHPQFSYPVQNKGKCRLATPQRQKMWYSEPRAGRSSEI